jgi:hypothetical protein
MIPIALIIAGVQAAGEIAKAALASDQVSLADREALARAIEMDWRTLDAALEKRKAELSAGAQAAPGTS